MVGVFVGVDVGVGVGAPVRDASVALVVDTALVLPAATGSFTRGPTTVASLILFCALHRTSMNAPWKVESRCEHTDGIPP